MKLIEKTWQNRRDFDGIYECEGCGHKQEEKDCYDDRNFHDNVSPNWKCSQCGKSTIDLGADVEKVQTRYADYEVV